MLLRDFEVVERNERRIEISQKEAIKLKSLFTEERILMKKHGIKSIKIEYANK